MLRIGILVGSTRPRRRGEAVARWVHEVAARHAASGGQDVSFEVVDLSGYRLPLLDEPAPAAIGDYQHEHTRRWAQKVGSLDGFVFVTPEYNHSVPAALKNSIDFLFAEWNDKAAGFVSYGFNGGIRAVEHLRLALAELKVACVRSQVALSLRGDFEFSGVTEPGVCTPAGHHEQILHRLLDEVISWAAALKPLRVPTSAEVETIRV
ncbi:MAG TPA: NAD(P)H-dependent oxidoreductase [Streptosporangiaceae bacterium]|jgi:NAD(P)H-dependent FMN reductase